MRSSSAGVREKHIPGDFAQGSDSGDDERLASKEKAKRFLNQVGNY
jgi:hypothetical protein